MAAFLDIMYYYAIFNYDRDRDSFNSSTISSDDDKKERMSKEDANAIPEITYHPTIETETCAARHQLSSSPLSPPPRPKAAATEASIELSSSASNANKAACAICILDYKAGDKLKILPDCNHVFHTDCIVPWLTERSGHCPLCRLTVHGGTSDGGNRRRFHRSRSSRCADVTCSIQ
jgi:hypothetical protein